MWEVRGERFEIGKNRRIYAKMKLMVLELEFPLTKRQTEELAKFCLDVSKLCIGTWILGLFTSRTEPSQAVLAFVGLTLAILFFTFGMRLFREVNKYGY